LITDGDLDTRIPCLGWDSENKGSFGD
jgi:hypothetical protein